MLMLTELVGVACREGHVLQDWQDAILVPILKKGNLCCCDNLRGIALLQVVGILVAKFVQNRLQQLAERESPASQCDFKRGHSCTDMIFLVQQLTKKAIEHNAKQFFIFVDLCKAYVFVPCAALWIALQMLRVPEDVIKLVKSFHENMKARVRVDGELLEEIKVSNGLRQGCTLAPTLFNIYASIVAERWLDRIRTVESVDTLIINKRDGLLFWKSTRYTNRTMRIFRTLIHCNSR